MENTVQNHIENLVAILNKRAPQSPHKISFTVNYGKKYAKIVSDTTGVHAFIDPETGAVYKPAGWKAPAKGVRFNLLNDASREACFKYADYAGGYLYRYR